MGTNTERSMGPRAEGPIPCFPGEPGRPQGGNNRVGCARLNNGPPNVHILIPVPVNMLPYIAKRDIASKIKLRILRWGKLSWWVQCNHKILTRGRQVSRISEDVVMILHCRL